MTRKVQPQAIDGPSVQEIADFEKPYFMQAVSTLDGGLIGSEDFAKRIADMGIVPQLADPNDQYCSIGFCKSEQRWYGWSHRAIFGFGIGSEVKKGDCAYIATDADDYVEQLVDFYSDPERHDTIGQIVKDDDGNNVVRISYIYHDAIDSHGLVHGHDHPIPSVFGRGEWTAMTLDDAKQMAIDFARGVS